MKTWKGWFGLFIASVLLNSGGLALAESPLASLLPFKQIDADPNQAYALQEEHGPWLILAASFAGEGADRQAHELVMELRKRYKLPAYVHRQEYDFTEPVEGLTINRYGEKQRMRYANASRYDALGVLVGDFPSVDDAQLERTLDKIKHARPDCLDLKKRKTSTQNFVALREWYRRINGDEEKRSKGPMGNAFATRNPLLPATYFAPDGPDAFVTNLNRGVKFSLLDNPAAYTVRVATFRGKDTIKQQEIEEIQRAGKVTDRLEIAADKRIA